MANPHSESLMDQSKKSRKDGLQPQKIYQVEPSAKEKHPKKVVFNPPALQRQDAGLKEDDDKKNTKRDEPEKARHDARGRTKWFSK